VRVLIITTGILCLVASNAWAEEDAPGEAPPPSEGATAAVEGEASASGEGTTPETATEEPPSAPEGPAPDVASAEESSDGTTAEGEETADGKEAAEEEEEVDPASDPPPAPVTKEPNALKTRVSGRLRSEMFLSQRARMRSLGGGRYGVRAVNVFPFYETIELRADEIGHRGLSIHFQGWAGLDLADVHFDQRFVADPTYFYLQFRDYGADIKVGRQQVYTGTARGLHLDGIHVSYESPIHLGIEALGGLVVSPYRGPDWYREQPANIGYDGFGAGFSDWEREGDYAIGGRLFYRLAGKASAGLSILHVTEFNEVDRQLFGIDLDMTPLKWFGATGNATMDLTSTKLQEANLGFDFYPHKAITISTEYRHTDPTLYLSHMSIFSVFSTEEYDSVGGQVQLRPIDALHFHAGYHHHFYSYIEQETGEESVTYDDEIDMGYELHVGGAVQFGARHDGMVLLNYRRLAEHEQGLNQLRLGAVVPFGPAGLKASANAYLDLYDEEINETTVGFLGDLGLFYGNGTIDVGGSFAAGLTPYAEQELRGMLKLVYNFDVSFVERRQP